MLEVMVKEKKRKPRKKKRMKRKKKVKIKSNITLMNQRRKRLRFQNVICMKLIDCMLLFVQLRMIAKSLLLEHSS